MRQFHNSGQLPLVKPRQRVDKCKWKENIASLAQTLGSLVVSTRQGSFLSLDEGFASWRDLTMRLRENNRTIYLIGNGASASMASHMAADLAKNAHIHTEVFTDLALITAIANDLSFADVYAEPLRRRFKDDDMLVAISSSGNSANIVKSCQTAYDMGGSVVTLSAMDSDNKIRNWGDLNLWVPAASYGLAETCHAAILHYWMDDIASMVQGESIDRESRHTMREAPTNPEPSGSGPRTVHGGVRRPCTHGRQDAGAPPIGRGAPRRSKGR